MRFLLTLILASGSPTSDIPHFTSADIPAWRAHIRPAASDVAFAEIPWLATFEAGVRAADAQQKPLLFWAMNGHPLGCT